MIHGRQKCTVAEILEVLERSATAGTKWIRRACRDVERGAASPPEAEAADALLGQGMPFYVNCAVHVGKVLLGVVDIWLVGRGTGGELDSREQLDLLDATLRRDKGFVRAGLSLEHITPNDFRRDPSAFVQAYARRLTAVRRSGLRSPPGCG